MAESQIASPLDQRIEDTDFRSEAWVSDGMNTRIINALRRAGIFTIGELVERTVLEVENIQGIRVVALVVIELKLESMGLALKEDT